MARIIRTGECNHCGWCCDFTGQTTALVRLSPAADVEFYRVRGFHLYEDNGQQIAQARVHMALPCPWHEHEEARCRHYDQRPQTCRDFPIRPEQIVGTPCSFWFEEE